MAFPGGSDGKESTCNARDPDLIPGVGRSPGEGNGNPFQYSCWEIPWTEEPGKLRVHGVTRVTRNLVTKPPSPIKINTFENKIY